MIKRECVDEEHWVDEETFKKTLAVYQVLPGPEAHELCVYFGRIQGGKLGGFLAGLGFMLPGSVLMLALSVLYVEADLADHLDELFYGLKAAVGAIVARALVRLSRSFITDVPLVLLALAAFALTVFASASFALLLLGAGLAYELWTNASRWTRRAHSFAPGPGAVIAVTTGALTFSLTAEIFWEGLKAGLVTFGGAYTVIPYLHDAAVDGQHWLTDPQFVDGLAMSGVLPAPLIIFHLRGLSRRRPRRRAGDDSRNLHPGLRIPNLLPPLARRGRREPTHTAVSARRGRRRYWSDRCGDRRDPRHERRRRADRPPGGRGIRGAEPLARKAHHRRCRARLRRRRGPAAGHQCRLSEGITLAATGSSSAKLGPLKASRR
jgi:chromate transport protein ChrA